MPGETGLSIASNGIINFANGQSFPGVGTGTITGVTAGTDLTGGGTTGTVTVGLDTTKVPQLGAPNTYAANQTVNGSVTATSFAGGGAGLTNLQGANVQGAVSTATNALGLGGFPPSAYQSAGSYATTGANTFTGDQSITGNVTVSANLSVNNGNVNLPTTSSSGGAIYMGSGLFAHACCGATTFNTFLGLSAGNVNSTNTGNSNVGIGGFALVSNTSGLSNTAVGTSAMQANTSGQNNTAVGWNALVSNGNQNDNTAVGASSLQQNTSGFDNTAVGRASLPANTSGAGNTAVGYIALQNNSTGSNNIAIGYGAGESITSTSNNIYIGHPGVAGDSGVIRIGTSGPQTSVYIAGIANNVSGSEVVVSTSGQLGYVPSSRRYKEDIKDMGDASHGLLQLRPVMFRYKEPYRDGSRPIQYGLIAEEVADVYPDLVVHGVDGQIETVKYHVLVPMLLNELQRQNAAIAALEERLARAEALLENRGR